MTMMDHADLTERIIGLAYEVHNELGGGFLESVYETAMSMVLSDAGLTFERQAPVPVVFRGKVIGDFKADLLIEQCVIVELKAVESLNKTHEVQLVNYLKATGIDVGLLINFGPERVAIRRKVRDLQRHPVNPADPVILSNPEPSQA
ncbi:MAG: GxxExxY protein [Planctomycetota bacterium]